MAPEIRQNQVYDGRKTDIFSMGVVLFTIVVGYFPFSSADLKDQFYDFLNNGTRNDNGINDAYWETLKASELSTEFKDLMQQILTIDASKRLTIEQIREHPWLNNKINEEKFEDLRQVLQNCRSQGEHAGECLKSYI